MIDKEPSVKDMARLWDMCVQFIESNNISCKETVYLTDRVIENAYSFIGSICDEVGYVDYEDEDE